jgi:hypothetical protein
MPIRARSTSSQRPTISELETKNGDCAGEIIGDNGFISVLLHTQHGSKPKKETEPWKQSSNLNNHFDPSDLSTDY